MARVKSCRYETARLEVGSWHEVPLLSPDARLADVIAAMLTERVTASLPPGWQGRYDTTRAQRWIDERDAECTALLAVGKDSGEPVAVVLLFAESATALRLGYLLNEPAWGKGFASELITGLISWCQTAGIDSVTGGVARDNPASARVLEKAGFRALPSDVEHEEILFRWLAA